jgi:hypothetical protein
VERNMWKLFPRMVDVLAPAQLGNVEIRHFTVSEEEAEAWSYQRMEVWVAGTYCQLDIDGLGWMYDAFQERLWNRKVVYRAHGDVLIGGLGMGMILHPILAKPEVRSVRVLELNPNVVTLVEPSLRSAPGYEKLTIEMADVYNWQPQPGQRFDTIWLDAIPCYARHQLFLRLAEAVMDRYRPFLRESPTAWLGHWAFEEVIQEMLTRIYDDNGSQSTEGGASVATRIDEACPYCGARPLNYFENLEPEDWTILEPRKHADDVACQRGCEELSQAEFEFDCEHCRAAIQATCVYAQPCDSNGYVLEMTWRKVAPPTPVQ